MAPFIPTLEGLLLLALNGPRDANKDQALNTVQHHDMHHRCVCVHTLVHFILMAAVYRSH